VNGLENKQDDNGCELNSFKQFLNSVASLLHKLHVTYEEVCLLEYNTMITDISNEHVTSIFRVEE
jgi:hypothetical protein